MKNSIIRSSSIAALLLVASCGTTDDAAASGAQGNLQAQENNGIGDEFPEQDAGYEDCATPPEEPPPVEVDAGYEDCATPPEEPPTVEEDAGEDCATPPPGNEFPDTGVPPTDTPDGGGGNPPPVVDCPQGGAVGAIAVEFACGAINVASCKDLSNVVLEFADGTRRKFDGLSGTSGTFSGSQVIVRAWIKAGSNASGDGPGYGERFEAPAGNCD